MCSCSPPRRAQVIGFAAKAKSDPQGFKASLHDSLPPQLADAIINTFLPEVPVAPPSSKQPSPAPTAGQPALKGPRLVVVKMRYFWLVQKFEHLLRTCACACVRAWWPVEYQGVAIH